MARFIDLPDCQRVTGVARAGVELNIQWSALPETPPSQPPQPTVYALKMSSNEAWRLMQFLAAH